jgi:predicted permease
VTLRDLALRLRALIFPTRFEQDLDEELSFHLEKETQKLVAAGVAPVDARAQAKARFGNVALTADECRDARGTAFVTSLARDIAYAFRTFNRAPLPALTIVGTLGLGLGLVAVVFTIVSPYLFRVDAVPRPKEIVEIRAALGSGDAWQRLKRSQLDSLRRETTALADPFAMLENIESRIDGRMMLGTAVSGNFFQALGVGAAAGRVLTPADDDRAAPQRALVLSSRGWQRRFESDPAVVGRTLTINGTPFEIVGVMPEGFRGLASVAPDYWAPLSLIGALRPADAGEENSVAVSIVGRVRSGVSKSAARDEIAAWFSREPKVIAGPRQPRIELIPRQGNVKLSSEDMLAFAPLCVSFGLILVIACANVANLLLARGVSRQREIGIRLSIGATRRRIVRQLLTENFLLALAAAAVGYWVSRALVGIALRAIADSLPPEAADMVTLSLPPSDWRVMLFLVAGAMMSTVFFALSPSLQATRLELVRVIRGEVGGDGRPKRSRNLLIVIQVTAAALLLTCSAIFLRSVLASSSFVSGYRTADTILIDMNSEAKRTPLLGAAESSPLVAAIAAATPDMLGGSREASVALTGERLWASYKFVSPNYMEVFDLPMSRGRGFSAAERTRDAAVAIVSETLAHRLRPDGDVLGRPLSVDGGPNEPKEDPLTRRTVTIVGIRKDIPGFRVIGGGEAELYLPTNASEPRATLIVRVRGDVDQARRALLKELTLVDPDLGQMMSMKTVARLETYMLQIAFWVTVILGGLALALTLAGLFSMLSYLVEQRAKEIGVRMALGANARTIGWLVLAETFRPVGVGLLIGTGLALTLAVVIRALSSEFSAVVHVLDPVAYAVSLIVIVTACFAAALTPARRAVRIDPIASLRQE